jgi:hypothetical protein
MVELETQVVEGQDNGQSSMNNGIDFQRDKLLSAYHDLRNLEEQWFSELNKDGFVKTVLGRSLEFNSSSLYLLSEIHNTYGRNTIPKEVVKDYQYLNSIGSQCISRFRVEGEGLDERLRYLSTLIRNRNEDLR